MILFASSTTHAHLAIVRQGEESADVPENDEHFGTVVAAGDFDQDGFDDLVVGTPDENVNFSGPSASQGLVTINDGTALGLTHVNAQSLSAADPLDSDILFGASFAVGDFNQDGVDDLAIGAPHADLPGLSNAGQVFVHHGIAGNSLSGAPAIVLSESDGGSFSTPDGAFGFALAAGDFNGDGFDDLAVAALHAVTSASWVLVFQGSAAGITTTGAFSISESDLGLPSGIGNRFGFALAAGDFRDTGESDLAIGVPFAEVDLQAEAGQVIVLRGDPILVIDTTSVGTFEAPTPQAGEHFGWSLAAGRFYDDSAYDDLAAGAPHYDGDPWTDSGRVLVKQYDSSAITTIRTLTQDDGALGVAASAAWFGHSLAAGELLDLANSLWGFDGLDELAVGAPGRFASYGEINIAGAGTVDLFPGRTDGPDGTGAINRNARDLNDIWFDTDEHLGWALCFGKFDATGRPNLAIGVPDKDIPAFIDLETDIGQAGQVNIFAPWRQPSGRPHRSSLVFDCADRIIYSQRFRQRLTPASTTKALTALLACEAIENNQVDPLQEFTIPDWVANEVNGGQLGLEENELISFMDLLYCMILKSGNDCAYEVAHILTGEDNVWQQGAIFMVNMVSVVLDFANMMDARASQLGASARTDFSNPAGRPYGYHWVTAEDMAIITREAMKNDHFRDLVATPEAVLLRDTPSDGGFLHYLANGWLAGLKGQLATTIGVKGGSNQPSQKTGLGAAELNNGRVIAAWFGVPPGLGSNTGLGGDLMKLVSPDCSPIDLVPAQLDPPEAGFDEPMTQSNLPTDDGESACVSGIFNETAFEYRVVEVLRRAAPSSTTNLELRVSRVLELSLEPGETREIHIDSMTSHDGYTIRYTGETDTAELDVLQSHPSGFSQYSLSPGERVMLPTYGAGATFGTTVGSGDASGAGAAFRETFSLTITNTARAGAVTLDVEELGYHTNVVLGDGITAPATFSAELFAQGNYSLEQVEVCVTGLDPVTGNTVDVSVHAFGHSTAAPDTPPVAVHDELVRDLSGYPNPFNPSTTLSFELRRAAPVTVRVFDVKGRHVRVVRPATWLDAGRHELRWDGRDDAGRTVASGSYWFTVESEGRRWSKSVLLLK